MADEACVEDVSSRKAAMVEGHDWHNEGGHEDLDG
jgi:hypothetical protein